MARKKKRNPRVRESFVTVVPAGGAVAEYTDLSQYIAVSSETPSVTQVLENDVGKNGVLFEETVNLDAVVSAALYNVRCRDYAISVKARHRIQMIADIVTDKRHGWQPADAAPSDKDLWASEKERFLFSYLLSSSEMETEKLLPLLEKWIITGTMGRFFLRADEGRMRMIKDMQTKKPFVTSFLRESGVYDISLVMLSQIPAADYFDQFLFFGFAFSPVVIQRTAARSKGGFCRLITAVTYDERNLHVPSVISRVIESERSITRHARVANTHRQ